MHRSNGRKCHGNIIHDGSAAVYSNFCHIEFFVSLGLRSCASVYRGETGIVIPVCVRPSANKLTKAVMDVSQCQCHCQSSIYIAHHRESL